MSKAPLVTSLAIENGREGFPTLSETEGRF